MQLQNPTMNDVLRAASFPVRNDAVVAHSTAIQPEASFFPQKDVEEMLKKPEQKFKKGGQIGMSKMEAVRSKLGKLNLVSFFIQLR